MLSLATLTAGATLAAALPAGQGHAQESRPELGKLAESPPRPLPTFGFADESGANKTLADYAGKPVVLNLWATWCPPCVAEMPSLDRLQAALASTGLVVLPLSSDRGGVPVVQAFYRSHEISRLGLFTDKGSAAVRTLGARGLPTTILVDRQGRERARLEGGAEWDKPDMVAAIRRLLLDDKPADETQPT